MILTFTFTFYFLKKFGHFIYVPNFDYLRNLDLFIDLTQSNLAHFLPFLSFLIQWRFCHLRLRLNPI